MNKQIFIINGSGRVGKDTFVECVNPCLSVLSETFPELTYAINYSSVDKIKRIAKIIGWTGTKTEKDRKFLSDLKVICSNYNDLPFNDMSDKIEMFNVSQACMIFLHIREPEEIERVKNTFKAKTILIKRDSVEPITSNMADKNVNNYDYDIVINNNGSIGDLMEKTRIFILDYCKGAYKKEY